MLWYFGEDADGERKHQRRQHTAKHNRDAAGVPEVFQVLHNKSAGAAVEQNAEQYDTNAKGQP